jgi:predicted phage baseplate assembly protein
MSLTDPLCTLPAPATSNCCSRAPQPPAAPLFIYNAPGLSAIQYRIGTFTSFRRAMLNRVAAPDLLAGASPVPPNPFANWHEGIDGDYQTMFIELWAYLADVLTFYQERIANEAFITTATQRDSLLRLVSLIDYRPSPGAGASGLVAFTVAKDKVLTVPPRFRVGSRALPAKPGVVFETASAIAAVGNSSAILLATASPAIPFPSGAIVLQQVNNRLAVSDYILAVENEGTPDEAAHLLRITALSLDKQANTTTVGWQEVGGTFTQASKQVAVYALRVTAGPFGNTAPPWSSLSPTLTNADRQHPQAPYIDNWDLNLISEPVDLLTPTTIFTQAVSRSLRLDLLGSYISIPNSSFYIPAPGDPNNTLFLDGVYNDAKGTQQNPTWAVLLTDGQIGDGPVAQILHIVDSRQSSKTAYTITSKVTRLTFRESVLPLVFPFRNTVILAGSQPLTLQNDLPLPDPVTGGTLTLAGLHPELQDGQKVMLRGNLFDSTLNQPTATPATESGILDGPPVVDATNTITTVNLKKPLLNPYVRRSCVLAANVVEATQGQTIKDEVLGSSDGSAFQSYGLKQKPLTYLPSSNPESVAAVQSTLLVTVNGVAWDEQATLAGSSPHAQDFTTALDDSGQTTVIFGDGVSGARPPSGTNNIHARYRKGLGASGNLPSDSIQQLVDSIAGLQKVTNPAPSTGGGDPESIAQIREKAPASLRSFGRAVGTADYAALALSYPGIAKASATYVLKDPITSRPIPHPFVQLTAATVDEVPFQGTVFASKLRRFLDNHRDPNVALRILDYSPVYIEVALEVDIDDHFPHQGTLAAVEAALNPGLNPDGSAGYFAFERLQFGQSIYLSALYAVVQAVPGVKDGTITTLRRISPGIANATSPAVTDILLGPTEIVIFDPADPAKGKLTITGQGGFRDT